MANKERRTRATILLDWREGRISASDAEIELGLAPGMLARTPRGSVNQSLDAGEVADIDKTSLNRAHREILERQSEVYEFAIGANKLDVALKATEAMADVIDRLATSQGLADGLDRALGRTGPIQIGSIDIQQIIALPGLNLGRPTEVIDAPQIIDTEPA